MIRFVLVHGSWHDGSLWGPVAEALRAGGHEVHTPTIAGHGRGVPKDVDHDDCVRSIVDAITTADLADVVLVGHSFGGTVIARVSEEVPERLRRLVFWNGFVPEPGNSLNDETPPHRRELFAGVAAASADNTVTLPFPIWRENFIQDADLSTAQETYGQLSSEPYQPFLDRRPLEGFSANAHGIPRSCVNGTEDIALPPGEWGWRPRMSFRLGGPRLVQLPGSHEVVFTNPTLLATKLVEAGRD